MTNYAFTNWARFSVVLSFLLLIGAPIQGSADQRPSGQFTITGAEVSAINRTKANGKISDAKSDVLTYWVRFDIRTQAKMVAGSEQKPFKLTNPTDPAKSSLTINKPIQYRGKDVPAGTNLLQLKDPRSILAPVRMPKLSPLSIQSLRMGADFDFPVDTYTLTFHWETVDGTVFNETVEVRIDLKK